MVTLLFLLIILILMAEFLLFVGGFVMGGIRKPNVVIHDVVPYRDYPHEEGNIDLGHGWNEILVPTTQPPTRVWLCFVDNEGVQCCLGSVDMFSTQCTAEGFVVVANVNSESANVRWIAEFA
jgi:hypothetical protein